MASVKASREKRISAGKYLCELLRGALVDDYIPKDLPEDLSLGTVFSLARYNSVESIAYFGVIKKDFPDEEDLIAKWKKSADSVIYKQAHFDSERESILRKMDAANISYINLKGIHIADLYPKPGMRSMSDNDILYGFVKKDNDGIYRASDRSEAQQTVRNIMLSEGYEPKGTEENHDVYYKKPFLNFEMHREIISEKKPHYWYYENPWSRAVPTTDKSREFMYSEEDNYIYSIVHMYVHYSEGGCGIRHITDLFVTDSVLGGTLDYGYINSELEKLGLSELFEKIRKFTGTVFFGNGEFDAEDEKFLLLFTGSGTYGNRTEYQNIALDNLEKDTGKTGTALKLEYLKRRIFLSPEACKRQYPKFYGKPYLTPVLIVYRLFRGLFTNFGRLWRELVRLIKRK